MTEGPGVHDPGTVDETTHGDEDMDLDAALHAVSAEDLTDGPEMPQEHDDALDGANLEVLVDYDTADVSMGLDVFVADDETVPVRIPLDTHDMVSLVTGLQTARAEQRQLLGVPEPPDSKDGDRWHVFGSAAGNKFVDPAGFSALNLPKTILGVPRSQAIVIFLVMLFMISLFTVII